MRCSLFALKRAASVDQAPRSRHSATVCTGVCARRPGPHEVNHPEGNSGAKLKSIPHRCYLRDVAFEWKLARITIYSPLGCLQGGDEPMLTRAELGLTCPCSLRKKISCLSAHPEPCFSPLALFHCLASCHQPSRFRDGIHEVFQPRARTGYETFRPSMVGSNRPIFDSLCQRSEYESLQVKKSPILVQKLTFEEIDKSFQP